MKNQKGHHLMIFYCEGAQDREALASWTLISKIARLILALIVSLVIRSIKPIQRLFLPNRTVPKSSQPSNKPLLSMQLLNDRTILFIVSSWKKKLIVSMTEQRPNVVDFLTMNLNSGGDPFHTIAFLSRPYNFSYFYSTLGTFQFDFILASFRQPVRCIDKVRRALLSV